MIKEYIFTICRVEYLLLCRLDCLHDVQLIIKVNLWKISGRLHKLGKNPVFSLVMEMISI